MKWPLLILAYTSLTQASMLPFNTWSIPVDAKYQSHISKEDVDEIIVNLQNLYNYELAQKNLMVIYDNDFQKPYMTAYVKPVAINIYKISIWGGFVRIPHMTKDSVLLTLCHELGHVLGGTPKMKINEFNWSSAEGQSDYYASYCFKKYLNRFDSRANFNSRGRAAITALSKTLNHIMPSNKVGKIETPSSEIIDETLYNSYPNLQCRVDTMYRSLECQVGSEDFKVCNTPLSRPLCWFNPLPL